MRAILIALALLLMGACGSDSKQQASSAGAELTAAARTLDRLTRQYAAAAFVNYREQLADLGRRALPPDLQGPWTAARPAVERPCLDDRCDWRAQVRALDAAADAFRRASGD